MPMGPIDLLLCVRYSIVLHKETLERPSRVLATSRSDSSPCHLRQICLKHFLRCSTVKTNTLDLDLRPGQLPHIVENIMNRCDVKTIEEV